jgi:Fe2+ transport system protein B
MENITRIVDLPDLPYNNSQQFSSQSQLELSNSYVPINVHPNPYGVSAQNPILPSPSQITDEQKSQIESLQKQRLPSRDIPQDQSNYTNDEEITPNYIPRKAQKNDYVRDYEDMTEKNLKEYEEKNRKEKMIDRILTEFQTPVFIIILFFLFQLPIINTMIFKRFSFLSIYNTDGNFNMIGLVLKSIIFGGLYYFTMKFTTFLSDL